MNQKIANTKDDFISVIAIHANTRKRLKHMHHINDMLSEMSLPFPSEKEYSSIKKPPSLN